MNCMFYLDSFELKIITEKQNIFGVFNLSEKKIGRFSFQLNHEVVSVIMRSMTDTKLYPLPHQTYKWKVQQP